MVSGVGFLRGGFILTVLKDAGTMPEVREELMRVLRNGRRSLEVAWRREEEIGSRGHVMAWLELTILLTSLEVRVIKWAKTEVKMGGGWMVAGLNVELMSFTFWVK